MQHELIRLEAGAKPDEILEAIEEDGAVIVEHFLTDARADGIVEELWPYIARTAPVGDDFAGHQTTRTGGLQNKSQGIRELLVDPLVLDAAKAFLEPHTEKVQLNLSQIIRLLPGQPAQELHRDRFVWGKKMPRSFEPQFNTIFALNDFTAENGATRVVPGSHRWDWDRKAEPGEILQAVMPKGSVVMYSGSVLHSGGENRSDGDRIALNVDYNCAWLRQEENQYMSSPPEIAATFSKALRDLLGYTMANYGLGYYSSPAFVPGIPDTLPPEVAFIAEEDATRLQDQTLRDQVLGEQMEIDTF
ncbi:MAG: phytanoyl-CoA dioxygenase family protein [Myxococcota bacterium]